MALNLLSYIARSCGPISGSRVTVAHDSLMRKAARQADAMGISRNSLAMWVWRAHNSMRSGIERNNGGGDKRVVNGAAQMNKLRGKIARKENLNEQSD